MGSLLFAKPGAVRFPPGPPYNASISSHPYSDWGIRARYDLTPEIYSMTGAYNTYANFRSIQWHGADFSIRHNSVAAPFQEFGYSPDYLRVRDYLGTIKVGGFYDSEPLRQFVLHRITGTWMVYGLAEQRLYTPLSVSNWMRKGDRFSLAASEGESAST